MMKLDDMFSVKITLRVISVGFLFSRHNSDKGVHRHGTIRIQRNRVDLLVSFHIFTAVNTATIGFSYSVVNSILSDRQGKQIATLSAAAGWGAVGFDGVPWYPAIHSFIHKLWHVGIKASTSPLSAHVKSIMANQQVPSWHWPVWRHVCVCVSSFSSCDLRNSAWVINKRIVDLRPAGLLSAWFYQIQTQPLNPPSSSWPKWQDILLSSDIWRN